MSNIFFLNKFDSRKLLLNYADVSITTSTLTTAIHSENFFNIFDHQVSTLNNYAVEL